MRQTMNELPHAGLADVLVAVKPGLPKIFGDRDVGRKLAPACGHLRPVHAKNDAAVGVRNRARAPLVDDGIERIGVRGGMSALDTHASRRPCTRLLLRGRSMTRLLRAGSLVLWSFSGGYRP